MAGLQIFDACNSFGLKVHGVAGSPPVTFVVARKRHGTRLYSLDRQTCDREGNLFAGGSSWHSWCVHSPQESRWLGFVSRPVQTVSLGSI